MDDNAELPPHVTEGMFLPFALGFFVMNWGQHERHLARLIATLEHYDDLPLIDASYIQVRDTLLDGHIEGFESSLRNWSSSEKFSGLNASLVALIDHQAVIRQIRHKLYHGYWAGYEDSGLNVLKVKRRGEEEIANPFSFREVFEWGREVQKVSSQCGQIEIGLKKAAELGIEVIDEAAWAEIVKAAG